MAPMRTGGSLAVAALLWQGALSMRTRRKSAVASRTLAGVPVYGARAASDEEADYMVVFNRKVTNAELDAFCKAKGPSCFMVGHPDQGGMPFVGLHGKEAEFETKVADKAFHIEYMERDVIVEDDPELEEESSPSALSNVEWGLERIGVPSAKSKGKGVHVYVLDAGIRVSHEDFGGRAIPTLDAGFRPPKVCDPTDETCAMDNRGHGTHCAGSVGGTRYGVAPQSLLHAMDRGSSYGDAFSSMDWLGGNVQFPAVLTMSFGGGGQNNAAETAVDVLVEAGVTVVTSGGNNNYDACTNTFAFVPNAITVGSTTSTDARSYFSNYGSCINIFAPGSSIKSADYRSDTGTSVKSGTSMAGPHVAGAAALILAESPRLTPAQVRQRLISSAETGVVTDVLGSPNLLLNVRG